MNCANVACIEFKTCGHRDELEHCGYEKWLRNIGEVQDAYKVSIASERCEVHL